MNRHEFTMIIQYAGVLPPAHLVASRRQGIADLEPRTVRDAAGKDGVPKARPGHFDSVGGAPSAKIGGCSSAY